MNAGKFVYLLKPGLRWPAGVDAPRMQRKIESSPAIRPDACKAFQVPSKGGGPTARRYIAAPFSFAGAVDRHGRTMRMMCPLATAN